MESGKKTSVIIAAGGSAERFGQGNLVSKQFLLLSGKSLLFHSMEKFLNLKNLIEIIIVTNDVNSTKKLLQEINYIKNVRTKIIEGGKLRQDSVYNGFCEVDHSVDLVVIHDVARPLFQINDLEKCIKAASSTGVAILAVPAVDTIKSSKSDKDRLVVKNTLDRNELFLIQTPQVFSYNLLSRGYKMLMNSDLKQVITDEASMIEILGEEVELISGDRTNIKITYPEDLKIAEWILKESENKKNKKLELIAE